MKISALFKNKRVVFFLVMIRMVISLVLVINSIITKDVYAAESPISAGGGINEFSSDIYTNGEGSYVSYRIFNAEVQYVYDSSGNKAMYPKYYDDSNFNKGGTRAAPSGTALKVIDYNEFSYNNKISKQDSGFFELDVVTQENLSENSRYTVYFTENAKYTFYVYNADSINEPNVSYYYLDDGADVAKFSSELSSSLFTSYTFNNENLPDGWWKTTIDLSSSVLTWSGQYVENTISKPLIGKERNNITSGTITARSLLMFEFSGCSLGPICRQGSTINLNNDSSQGSVVFYDVFGNSIADITSCELGYVMAESTSEMFVGFKEIISTKTDDGKFKFKFDATPLNITSNYLEYEYLGIMNITCGMNSDDFEITQSGVNINSSVTEENIKTTYTFTFKHDGNSNVNSITYTLKCVADGKIYSEGSFSTVSGTNISFDIYSTSILEFKFKTEKNTYSFIYNVIKNTNFELPTVAKIGTKEYKYIEDALWLSQPGDLIEVITNCEFKSKLNNENLNPIWTTDGAGYTIKDGVDLLLPYAEGQTTISDKSNTINANLDTLDSTSNKFNSSKQRLALTIPIGIELIVDDGGRLVVGGKVTGNAGYAGGTVPSYCNINLNGTITVNSGGILSTCGYIKSTKDSTTGDYIGKIDVKDGGYIYQPFVVIDFMGGGYTAVSAGNKASQAAGWLVQLAWSRSPLNLYSGETDISSFFVYTMPNIQSQLNLNAGAFLKGYACMKASGDPNLTVVSVIGESNSLVATGSNTDVEIIFDPSKAVNDTYYSGAGKTKMKIYGDVSLGDMSLLVAVSGMELTVYTSYLTFPIPFNYDIELNKHKNGDASTATVDYNMQILPGATVKVGSGATLNINSSRFVVHDGVYDLKSEPSSSELGDRAITDSQISRAYPTTAQLQANGYSNGTGNLIVDGTLNINSGAAFGGLIQSTSGEGTIVVNSGATLTASAQVGLSCSGRALQSYYFNGATVHTLKAQVFDAATGQRVDLLPGRTYNSLDGKNYVLDYYEYDLYSSYSSGTATTINLEYCTANSVNLSVITLNATVTGSWYSDTTKIQHKTQNNAIDSEEKIIYYCVGVNLKEALAYLGTCNNLPEATLGKDLSSTTHYYHDETASGVVSSDMTLIKCDICGDELTITGLIDSTFTIDNGVFKGEDYYAIVKVGNAYYFIENVKKDNNFAIVLNTDIVGQDLSNAEIQFIRDNVPNEGNGDIQLRGYQVSGTKVRFFATLSDELFSKFTTDDRGVLCHPDYGNITITVTLPNGKKGTVVTSQVYTYLYDNGTTDKYQFLDTYVFSVVVDFGDQLSSATNEITLKYTLAPRENSTAETLISSYELMVNYDTDSKVVTSVNNVHIEGDFVEPSVNA